MSYRREEILPHDICNTKGVLHMEPSCRDKAGRHQQLIEKVHKRGGVVLSGLYECSTSLYDVRCSCGHEWSTRWNRIVSQAKWCKPCSDKNRKRMPWSLQRCIDLAEAKGGTCVSTTYVNAHGLLSWKCGNPSHPVWETSPGEINRGRWCKHCARPIADEKRKNTIEEARTLAILRGGLCLSTAYVVSPGHMLWKCNTCDTEFHSSFNNVRCGSWCPPCSKKQGADKLRHTLEEVREDGAKRHYKLLSTTYNLNCDRLVWLCRRDHHCKMSYAHMMTKGRCNICEESKGERAVRLALEAQGLAYEKEWKLKDKRNRFDFYVPSLNLAIEYDGGFHFQPRAGDMEKFKRHLINDEIKDKYCEDNKISLFRISCFDKEHTVEEWTHIGIALIREADYYHISPHREYKNQLLAALQ
jgi:very-short-patch-repair endonuclease